MENATQAQDGQQPQTDPQQAAADPQQAQGGPEGKWIGYTKLDSFVRAGRVRRSPWRTQSTPGISPTSSSGR